MKVVREASALRSLLDVPRRPRAFLTGHIFHILNRGAKRQRLFDGPDDYDAFLRVLTVTVARRPVSLFAYCVMPNHFHLVMGVENSGSLSRFMHLLTTTHTRRWSLSRGIVGEGAVYQGRFKAIAVYGHRHFVAVCRYVERNPLRAGLVGRAEDWPWSSLAHQPEWPALVTGWPVERPPRWLEEVNRPQTQSEVEAIRASIRLHAALGSPDDTSPEPGPETPDPITNT